MEVIRPRLLTDYEKESNKEYRCSNFFVRDPFFTIGDIIIEGSLRFFYRRNEIFPVRKLIEDISYENKNLYVSVPRPAIFDGIECERGPFLKGGDILVLDKTVFVGKAGQASNDNGYIWYLQKFRWFILDVVHNLLVDIKLISLIKRL